MTLNKKNTVQCYKDKWTEVAQQMSVLKVSKPRFPNFALYGRYEVHNGHCLSNNTRNWVHTEVQEGGPFPSSMYKKDLDLIPAACARLSSRSRQSPPSSVFALHEKGLKLAVFYHQGEMIFLSTRKGWSLNVMGPLLHRRSYLSIPFKTKCRKSGFDRRAQSVNRKKERLLYIWNLSSKIKHISAFWGERKIEKLW